jgi:hypothetical protein
VNDVKVHKMRWLRTAAVGKEYCTMVVYLDKKEKVDKLLAREFVHMPNGGSRACNRVFGDVSRLVPANI